MTQANTHNNIPAPIDSTRRRFLTMSAAASVVSVGTIAAAAMPAPQATADDSELLRLEELIFEQHEKATADDDEIYRLSEIWTVESQRRYQEALAGEARTGVYLSPQERWRLATDMPECREHDRLCKLQEPHYREMDKLIEQMWATPAHTAEGRHAKVVVLLACLLSHNGWCETDDRVDYEKKRARDLLIELVGGEPADQLRDQFSAEPGALLS